MHRNGGRTKQLLAASCLLLLASAADAAAAASPAGHDGAAAIGAGGSRRLLQDPRPQLPAQRDWWSAALESSSTTEEQQSWWMDIITRTAQAIAQQTGATAEQQQRQPASSQSSVPFPPGGGETLNPSVPPAAAGGSALTASERANGLDSSSVWPPTTFKDSKERKAYEESTVENAADAAPCKAEGDGGLLCGIPVGYQGVANRTGYYYLPKTYTQGPLPVLVLLHGAGVNGSWMLYDLPFMEAADKFQVIVVAPDSIDDMDWSNPREASDGYTHDWWHIEACYHWFAMQNPQGARIDAARVAIAGNSRAGYTGPPFCSRSTLVPCSAAAIMHASAKPEEMGQKVIPILWTGGVNDPLYTEERNAGEIAAFKEARPEFPIDYTLWESSHSLNKDQEIDYVVHWGADVSFRGTPPPKLGTYRRRLAASTADRRRQIGATV